MSGLEIVGVVLGAYPIAYEFAKDLRGRYQRTGAWWRFDTEYGIFMEEVQHQMVISEQNKHNLVHLLDLTPEDKAVLIHSSDPKVWSQLNVQAELQRKIPGSQYTWFMGELKRLCDDLEKLHGLLPHGKEEYIDAETVEATFFRLKHSFSKKPKEVLEQMKKRNLAIHEYISRASLLSRSVEPVRAHSAIRGPPFTDLQGQTRRIFDCIQRHWACNCSSSHSCGITIARNTKSHDANTRPQMRIGLLFTEDVKLVRVMLELHQDPLINSNALSPLALSSNVLSNASQPEVIHSQLHDVDTFRQRTTAKSRWKKMSKRSSKGVTSLAAATMSLVGNPKAPTSVFTTMKKKGARLMKKRSISPPIVSSPLDRSQTNQTGPTDPNASVTSLGAKKPANARRVRFTEDDAENDEPSAKRVQVIAAPLGDICSLIDDDTTQDQTWFWEADKESKVLLRPAQRPYRVLDQQSSLHHFICDTNHRGKRVEIALRMLYTLLCLGHSELVPSSWAKTQMSIETSDEDTIPPQIYLFHESLGNALASGSKGVHPTHKAKKVLFIFGVLLLELLYGETFECRKEYQTLLSYKKDGEQLSLIDEQVVALEWQGCVTNDHGEEVADAIRHCLVCSFAAPLDLGKSEFAQAVWEGVGRPLQTFLKAWQVTAEYFADTEY